MLRLITLRMTRGSQGLQLSVYLWVSNRGKSKPGVGNEFRPVPVSVEACLHPACYLVVSLAEADLGLFRG